MLRKSLIALLVLLLCASTGVGGIRAPGKYAGIVIFDRWDTCYLYSGVYVMYVSDKTKQSLRKYEGKAIEIDAKEVFQPINPGDGLIGKFKTLGRAKTAPDARPTQGLRLKVKPGFDAKGLAQLVVEVENRGNRVIEVSTAELAPTLLGEKGEHQLFSPSDGKSEALITRCNFLLAKDWWMESNVRIQKPDGQFTNVNKRYAIKIDSGATQPNLFRLDGGAKQRFAISLDIPPGIYSFLCGYGGGVHERQGLASNIITFSVDGEGRATLISNRQLGEPSDENTNP